MATAAAGDVQIDSSIQIKGQFGTQPTEQHCAACWIGSGTFTDDQYSSLTIVNTPAGSSSSAAVGVIVRASGNAGTRSFYEFYIDGAATVNTTLVKWVSGTRTVLNTSTSPTWAAGDKIELEVEGTTVRAMKNGVALGGSYTTTDSSVTTGSPGVTVSAAQIMGDNWNAGNMTASGGANPARKLLLGVG